MQQQLINAMLSPDFYGAGIERVEHIETHISHVFLAGDYAYKVNKAVDLGFLNFKALDDRRFYCEEELRLNRRLAPELYLAVQPITGTPAHPVLGGQGAPIEFAVKMRRFAPDALLGGVLARGDLSGAAVDDIARQVADFHTSAATAPVSSGWGAPASIRAPALENFRQLRVLPVNQSGLRELQAWTAQQCKTLEPVMDGRRRGGFIRECHGDLHLDNMALVEGGVTIFDCLEFNEQLRWIDVMNEVAFLVMDFEFRNRPDLAWRFLNRYLEVTGDYEGLRMLRFYLVYRALVRAKVEALRAAQPDVDEPEEGELLGRYSRHIALARAQIRSPVTGLFITHGLSGSGKTTVTQSLLEATGAVRLRSDLERKRLYGLGSLAHTGSAIDAGLYAADATEHTYNRLRRLARTIIEAGYPVFVDATFLKRAQRDAVYGLALELKVDFRILDFTADREVLQQRLRERRKRNLDASEADAGVLVHQLRIQEPLEPDELRRTIRCDPALGAREAACGLAKQLQSF